MTSLATLFTLLGLIFDIGGRARMATGSGGLTPVLISIFVFTPQATLCKENGALLPTFILRVKLTNSIGYSGICWPKGPVA